MSVADPVQRCAECRLTWVARSRFDSFMESVERRFLPTDVAALQSECEQRHRALAALAFDEGATVRYYNCPVCANRMRRRAFAGHSGVISHTCSKHGVLLGTEDFELIQDFLRRGGEVIVLSRQIEELEQRLGQAEGRAKDIESRAAYGNSYYFFMGGGLT